MCMRICVRVCVYVNVYENVLQSQRPTSIYIYMCTRNLHIHTYIYIYIYVIVCICTNVCVCVCERIHTYVYEHMESGSGEVGRRRRRASVLTSEPSWAVLARPGASRGIALGRLGAIFGLGNQCSSGPCIDTVYCKLEFINITWERCFSMPTTSPMESKCRRKLPR